MKKPLTFAAVFLSALILLAPYGAKANSIITPSDFLQHSFEKTFDFLEYARMNAPGHGLPMPPANDHAYLHSVYVNVSGFQVFYSGLQNITDNGKTFTFPLQTMLFHFETKQGKDAAVASSFITLMAFNDTLPDLFPDQPSENDTVFASFSLGYNMTDIFGEAPPSLTTSAEIIPLTNTADLLQWNWGMKYKGLGAIWWRVDLNATHPRWDLLPVAVTVYDELTFTYNLTLNPTEKTAGVTQNYVIGRIEDLYIVGWPFPRLLTLHYNSTGTYRLGGARFGDTTVYQYLRDQDIRMSIVSYQVTALADFDTYSRTATGKNATNRDADVGNQSVTTYAQDNERVLDLDFGTKQDYTLYNYTQDPSETVGTTYQSEARTAQREGFARNPIFAVHTSLMRFLPLVLAHMDPALYNKVRTQLFNLSMADFFFMTSYPTYSGYKVEHDPIYTFQSQITPSSTTTTTTTQPATTSTTPPPQTTTTQATTTTQPSGTEEQLPLIIVVSAVTTIIVAAVAVAMVRRRPRAPQM